MARSALIAVFLAAGSVGTADVRLEVPFVRQEKRGCGAASAAMVAQYWSRQYPALGITNADPREACRELHSPETGGIRLSNMRRYLDDRGFHAFTLRASWADLHYHLSRQRPLIVCLKKRSQAEMHYVVVVGIGATRVWLNDPAHRKPNALDRSPFEQRWQTADRWVLLAVPRQSR